MLETFELRTSELLLHNEPFLSSYGINEHYLNFSEKVQGGYPNHDF